MKTFYFLLFYSGLILFIGCSEDTLTLENNQSIDTIGIETKDQGNTENYYSTELIAGQNINVGLITVSDLDSNLDVTYETYGDWVITDVHLFVGELNDLPTSNGGNPKIGKFTYSKTYSPGTTMASFIDLYEIAANKCVWVAAHAVVLNTITGQEETAWGLGVQINNSGNGNGNGNGNGGSWAMRFQVCNNGGPF